MGTQEPLRFNQYPPYLLAQYQQALPQHLPAEFQQQLGMGCLEQLAQMSEQEYWARREELMPRLRSAGLLSGRRLRVQGRWYPLEEYAAADDLMYPEDKRALNLLRRHLTDEQWACLGAKGYFEVTAQTRRYGRKSNHLFRIHSSFSVYEHEKNGRRHYCVVALEPGLPAWDWMLMVKLLIEADLPRFYATAKKRLFQPLERYDA